MATVRVEYDRTVDDSFFEKPTNLDTDCFECFLERMGMLPEGSVGYAPISEGKIYHGTGLED